MRCGAALDGANDRKAVNATTRDASRRTTATAPANTSISVASCAVHCNAALQRRYASVGERSPDPLGGSEFEMMKPDEAEGNLHECEKQKRQRERPRRRKSV